MRAAVNREREIQQDTGENWYVLTRTPVVTGRDLRSATESRNTEMPGQWQINFTLSGEAAHRFGPFTEQNRGRQMAIVSREEGVFGAGDTKPHRGFRTH